MFRQDPIRILVALTLGLAILYMGATHYYCSGELVAPQDDAYIYFQYARQIAGGQPFRYHDGASRSTGATGFLYPFLLAPFFLLSSEPSMIVLAAFVLGLASLLGAAILIFHIAGRTLSTGWATVTALLFLLNGHILWTGFSGLEAALFTLVCVAVFHLTLRAIDFGHAPWGATLLAGLLPFLRPEGTVIAAVWAAATAWKLRARGYRRSRSLLPFLALLGGVGYVGANYLVAGRFMGNTGVKPLLSYGLRPQWIGPLAAIYGKVLELFLGLRFGFVVFPLLGFLALWEIAAGWEEDSGHDLLAGWWLLGMALVGYASFQGGARDLTFRYVVPYYPPFVLLVGHGLARLARLSRPATARVAAVTVLAYGAVGAIVMAAFFGTCCKATLGLHGRAAHWQRAHLPEKAIIGCGDVGVLGFEAGRPIFDFVGLVTSEMTWLSQRGDGALYEAVAHLPPPLRPTHLCMYPGRFRELSSVLRGRHLASFTVRERFYRGTRLDIHEVAPRAFEEPRFQPRPGMIAVDELNVARLADEADHGYHPLTEPAFEPTTLIKRLAPKGGGRPWSDGGRRVLGESFRIKGLTPGRPLHVVLLTTNASDLDLRVRVDDVDVGSWRVASSPAGGERWTEASFVIAGGQVKRSTLDLDLRPPDMLYHVYYQSFRYRFLQEPPPRS